MVFKRNGGGWQADKVSRGDYRKLTASKGGVGPGEYHRA